MSETVQFQPMPGVILVKLQQEKKLGKIIIPSGLQKDDGALVGEVIKIGEGKEKKDGSLKKIPVSVGDRVFFKSYAGTSIPLDPRSEEKFKAIDVDDIVGKIEFGGNKNI